MKGKDAETCITSVAVRETWLKWWMQKLRSWTGNLKRILLQQKEGSSVTEVLATMKLGKRETSGDTLRSKELRLGEHWRTEQSFQRKR